MHSRARRSIRRLRLILSAASLWPRSSPPVPPSSAAVRPPKLDYNITTLPNGLTVVLSEDHSTPIVHLQLWYHVGSKNEKPGRTGFAHLFEHLMFKGSKNVEPEAHTSMIASVGGQSNAYTTDDETVFWETVPAQYLPLALWLEADRMATLRIDKDTFANEREVVKEERRMRVDNQPYGRLNEIIYDQAFTVHPYKHPTIGSMEDLEAASVDDVRDFYKTYYVPENATLALVGDFDTAQALQLVDAVPRAACRRPSAPVPRDIPKEPPQTKEKRVDAAGAVAAAGGRRRVSHHLRRPSRLVSAAHRVEGAVRRPELADLQEAGLREADRGRGVRRAPTSSRIRTCSTPSRSSSRGTRPRRRSTRSIAEFERLKAEPITRARAAADEEPVRARLHPRPRVEPAEGAAARARASSSTTTSRPPTASSTSSRTSRPPTCSASRAPTSRRRTGWC